MKFSLVFCLFWLIYCIEPVDNHFFKWLAQKAERVFNPSKAQRLFDCGKSDIAPKLPTKLDLPRVTGGLSAIDHSFPWMVNVLNLKSFSSCGGAIIGPDTIITAAHCITDERKHIRVVAGAATLLGRMNPFNYYKISDIIIHPNYVSCCDYDIAILKLKKKLERSEMINSICLPNERNQQLKDGTIAFIIGWGGKYPTGELNKFGSFHLKQGIVYVKSNEYCKSNFGTFDGQDEICATNVRDNVDSREGDSGGPLMILNQTDNRWYLFGITSHGANAELIKPGVYSSISTKLDFIRKYL